MPIRRSRTLSVAADAGYLFKRLKPGRYRSAGTITRHRVALTLSRKRVCRGYDEYLSLRYRPLQGSIPGATKLDFSYHC